MRNRSHYVAPVPDSITNMLPTDPDICPPVLAVSAAAYASLAVRVARSTPQNPNNLVSFFLFLLAGMVAGSAFSYGATDATLYGIGRTLSFFSAGFVPIVFYLIYREFTVGRPHALLIVMLAIIPVATTMSRDDQLAAHHDLDARPRRRMACSSRSCWITTGTVGSTRRLRMDCLGTQPSR